MSNSKSKTTAARVDDIVNYVETSSGLTYLLTESGKICVSQKADRKSIQFFSHDVNEVLHRIDSDGKSFLQVNFSSGNKVLITESLLGFKPIDIIGLDMARLPKVVTTPDLNSVFEAIQELLSAESSSEHEIEILKKVYQSILYGAERVGIALKEEKAWISRLAASKIKATA